MRFPSCWLRAEKVLSDFRIVDGSDGAKLVLPVIRRGSLDPKREPAGGGEKAPIYAKWCAGGPHVKVYLCAGLRLNLDDRAARPVDACLHPMVPGRHVKFDRPSVADPSNELVIEQDPVASDDVPPPRAVTVNDDARRRDHQSPFAGGSATLRAWLYTHKYSPGGRPRSGSRDVGRPVVQLSGPHRRRRTRRPNFATRWSPWRARYVPDRRARGGQ